jgi:hypothetical protein
MRTKTLLLGAAALAAGVMTSMAQNVYSVNVVGYINVPLATGYNLINNQLDVDGVDNVETVFPNVPNGCQILQWGGATFLPSITFFTGAGWFDQSLNPATNNVYPGSSFFLYNPGSVTNVTIVGTVIQGTNTTKVPSGYSFDAVIPPVASDLDTNGFPTTINGLQYSTFSNGTYTASYTYFSGAGWFDQGLNQVFPTPNVAQGFLIYNPTATTGTWSQQFNVQ